MGIIQAIKAATTKKQLVRTELLNTNNLLFTPFSGGAYDNDIYRGAVDAIARNAGKLKGQHVYYYDGTQKAGRDERLNRLLQIAPNEYMTAFDLFYKLTTHYYLFNNAFAFFNKDNKGNVISIYPITCSNADFFADPSDNVYIKFMFTNGNFYTLPYADIIHLRRCYNSNELLGDNNTAIYPALELAHTENEGIINGIKSGATLRGILKFTTILAPDKLKAEKEAFVNDYLDLSNNGGIAVTDSKSDYTPINNTPAKIDAEEIKQTKTKIYNYLGITEKIVNSSYTEDEFNAFFESVLEPLALQLSLEFTRKVFNEREQAFGNRIVFDSGRMIYSSNTTKLNLIKELLPFGMLTINQALEILNLPPVEGGEKRLQSLNYADADIVNEYQTGSNGNV